MTNLLEVKDLSVQYVIRGKPVHALKRASITIPSEGYTLGIVGESGSGKSTLGTSILNMIESPGRIVEGSIQFDGHDVLQMDDEELRGYRWEKVSMIYQAAMNSLNPVKRIYDPITEVLQEHKGMPRGEAREIAAKLLASVGIKQSRLHAFPHELSGGMRQRVVIALALALSPKLLIADEPTSALDVVVQRQIISLLKKEVLERHLSMIFITHEISLLPGIVENVAVMHNGEVVELGQIDQVLNTPQHPYTKKLLSNVLEIDTPIESVLSSQVVSR